MPAGGTPDDDEPYGVPGDLRPRDRSAPRPQPGPFAPRPLRPDPPATGGAPGPYPPYGTGPQAPGGPAGPGGGYGATGPAPYGGTGPAPYGAAGQNPYPPGDQDPYAPGSGGGWNRDPAGRDPYGPGGRDYDTGERDPYGTGGRDQRTGGSEPYGPGGRDPYGTGPGPAYGPGGTGTGGPGGEPGAGGGGRDPYGTGGYVHEGGFFGSQGGGLAGSRRDAGAPGPSYGPGDAGGPTGPVGPGYGASGWDYAAGPGGRGSGGPGSGSGGSGSGGPGDGPEGGRSGDGRRPGRRRRSLAALIGPLAGAIGLALLLGAGVYALASGSGCDGGTVDLNVAAAPDIAPAISDIAASFNKQHRSTGNKCVRAVVRAADPANTSTVLSGQGVVPGQTTPDVWIPDSSLWLDIVRSTPQGAANVHGTPTTVAETPLVVATSRAFAAKLKSQGVRPTWDMLLKATDALAAGAVSKNDMLPAGSVHLQILDPTRNAGGLGAVVMTHMLLQGDPNAGPIFTQIARKVQPSMSPNTTALFGVFSRNLHGRAPVVITPEQAVWKYDRAKGGAPATAIYPAEGTLTLDYPLALTTNDDTKIRAAGLLETAMGTAAAQSAVHALGFRTPDGHAGPDFGAAQGVSPRVPRALPTPDAGDVTGVMQAWTKLSLRTRMLTLLDVSGSMAQPVGGGLTRMTATAQVAQGGLAMLPDDTDLGLWTFSTNLDGPRPYRTQVPIGALSDRVGSGTRRQAILGALGRVRPVPNGNTGLYDSVLTAYKSMQNSYKVGYYNSILVLTDGKNDDTKGPTLNGLLSSLKKLSDPARPVMVIFIGFGPDVDMNAMQAIASATNGAAYHAIKPQDVQRFFLDSIARRICAPECH